MLNCAGLEDRIVLDTGRGLGAYLRCVLAAVCGGDAAAAGTDKRLGYMEALVRLLQHHPATEPLVPRPQPRPRQDVTRAGESPSRSSNRLPSAVMMV